jgi:tRNA-uridine 2-sulfurtransferase
MINMEKILVWLSGGVDSAVSALLLKKQGYTIAGWFMINYLDEQNPSCPTRVDLEEAKMVAAYLDIPFYTFDYREEYEKRIVEYIYREYNSGRTPNPDVFCNNLVKFDLFLEEALSLGFDGIATGHYARIENNQLFKWIDPNKDQSYFLSRLSPFQLSKARFPIGSFLKSEVRAIARKAGLPNAERKDSQGLCFIGKISMKEFLERRIEKRIGNILDTSGNILGTHEWVHSYTIWQRKWIKVGGGPARFVVAKDIQNNTLIVGTEDELLLFSSVCHLIDWVGEIPEFWKKYCAKIRYRQEDQPCTCHGEVQSNPESIQQQNRDCHESLSLNQKNLLSMTIYFDHPARAIASGQICVIYDGERVVWSGVIV